MTRVQVWLREHLGAAAIASACLMMAARSVAPEATWLLVILTGSFGLLWICRATTQDPWLARITMGSYALRVAATLALFCISLWKLPVLQYLQRGGGFLQIGGDGVGYHAHALRILDAWRTGLDLSSVFLVGSEEYTLYRDMALPIAIFYRILGPSVLHALLVNAWLGAVAVIPAYALVRRLADWRGARLSAALVGFWPSFIIWSTQLLKDPAVLVAILSLLWAIEATWRPRQRGRLRRAGAWAALVLSAGVLSYFRFYMGYVALGSLAVVMAIACLRHARSNQWRLAGRSVVLVAAVAASVLTARSIDFLKVCSPPSAELAHLRQGRNYEQAGALEHAMVSYIRALTVRPEFAKPRARLRPLVDLLVPDWQRQELHAVGETLVDHDEHPVQIHGPVSAAVIVKAIYLLKGGAEKPRSPEVVGQIRQMVQFTKLETLNVYRQGMINTPGYSNIDEHVAFRRMRDLLAYVPRALLIGFLSPFPTQWFDISGETGSLRMLASLEVLLIILLLPGLLYACWKLARCHGDSGRVIVLFSVLAAVLLSVTVTNIGILFRLRLQYLLPLFVALGIAGLPAPYGSFHWLPTCWQPRGTADAVSE